MRPTRLRIPYGTMATYASVGVFFYFVANAVGLVLANVLAILGHVSFDSPEYRRILDGLPVIGTTLILTATGFLGAAFVAAKAARAGVRDALGLRAADSRLFVAASLGIVGLGPLSDAIVRGFRFLFPTFTLGNLEALNEVARALPLVPTFLLVAVLAGTAEEIFFRGLVQRSIERTFVAIPVSALTFALIHFDPPHVVGVIPLGFYLAWMAHRSNSTWVTVCAHVVNNTVALAAVRLPGPEGPDESPAPPWVVVLGVVVTAMACWYVAYATRRRGLSPEGSRSERTSAISE